MEYSSNTLPIFLNEIPIKHVVNYKFLGVYIDEKLEMKQQYGYVTSKLGGVIGIIKKLNINLNLDTRILIFKSLFMSHLNYCSHIWGNTFKTNKSYIAISQERALKCIILNTNINIHDFMQSNFIFKFDDIVKFNSIKCIHRGFYNKLPINLKIRLIKNKNYCNKCIRKTSRTSRNLFRLTNIGVKYWNNLPSSLINISNLKLFSKHFKKIYI